MGGMDKCALLIGGRSLLSYSIAAFAEVVDTIVVVVAPDRVAAWTVDREYRSMATHWTDCGGRGRLARIRYARASMHCDVCIEIDVIAVHDGARPLVAVETIRRCIERAEADGATIAAVPVTDTIKRAT